MEFNEQSFWNFIVEYENRKTPLLLYTINGSKAHLISVENLFDNIIVIILDEMKEINIFIREGKIYSCFIRNEKLLPNSLIPINQKLDGESTKKYLTQYFYINVF